MEAENRLRVLAALPCYGAIHPHASDANALASRGKVILAPYWTVSSALCHSFNKAWCQALSLQRIGALDMFLMHHADIGIETLFWLDVMVEEMERTGAAVISVVQPIKNLTDETSTAGERDDPWLPRKFTLAELQKLPETFSAADTQSLHPGDLLVNTGLMLVDIRRPEFHEKDATGALKFFFTMLDRCIEDPGTEQLVSQFRPEDWEFSRMCNRAGLSVWATRKVKCVHYGSFGFKNYHEESAA